MLSKKLSNFKIIGIGVTIILILLLIIGYRLGYKKDLEKIDSNTVINNP